MYYNIFIIIYPQYVQKIDCIFKKNILDALKQLKWMPDESSQKFSEKHLFRT